MNSVYSLWTTVVLKSSNRGHTRKDVINAVRLIKEYSFTLGLQMMTGLPGDTDEKSHLIRRRNNKAET